MAPVAMTEDGLMNSLTSLAEKTARCGVRCVFDCPRPVRQTDADVAAHLYRIAQEAVNNSLKHGAPTEIRIGLEQNERTLVLEVDDDGTGFPANGPDSGGIGLRVMRYRASLIGGEFQTDSAPAGGAHVSCRVLLPQPA